MTCPHGHADLQITERLGVEVDYCPQCRGVWLDRGELDKLLDRAEQAPARGRRDDDHDEDDFRPYRGASGHPHGRRRKSWLGEILDF